MSHIHYVLDFIEDFYFLIFYNAKSGDFHGIFILFPVCACGAFRAIIL